MSKCTIGVDSENGDVTIGDSVLSGCDTGVSATSFGHRVGIGATVIEGSGAHGLKVVGAVTAATSNADLGGVELRGNAIGAWVHGNATLRMVDSTVVGHSVAGLELSTGALLDISNGAQNTFSDNPISVRLSFAAEPLLDGGLNEFYPEVALPVQVDGLMFSGTTDTGGVGCAAANPTLDASTNLWHHSYNGLTMTWQSATIDVGPHDLTDMAGCPYALLP